MTNRKTLPSFALGLSLVPCISQSPAEQTHPAARPVPARVYTNDDLARVRPFRDELGARSVPAVPQGTGEATAGPAGPRRRALAPEKVVARGEAYWRREAEKLRERLRTLSDQRDALRDRLAQRRDDERRVLRRARGSVSSQTDSDRTLEARIATIERRRRDLEEDLVDRARRAGAQPGWIR